jgi:hypothetical protein
MVLESNDYGVRGADMRSFECPTRHGSGGGNVKSGKRGQGDG